MYVARGTHHIFAHKTSKTKKSITLDTNEFKGLRDSSAN